MTLPVGRECVSPVVTLPVGRECVSPLTPCLRPRQVLDEEADVFVVKMWRLLIYEIQAKKNGLVK